MEYLKALNIIIYIISNMVTGYCFLRIFLYPMFRLLGNEKEFYSDPKFKKTMNLFYHARLYPWPIWDNGKRSKWIKAWWKYALTGIISFTITAITLYIQETLK